MVFCGHCGYQLAPGDTICPRCGAETEVDQLTHDPQAYNPTEMSQVIQQPSSPGNYENQPRRSNPALSPEPPGPLVLGPTGGNSFNDQLTNDATTMMMNAPTYASQQPYPGYPAQAGAGTYGYSAGYPAYQAGQSAAVIQLLETSRKGKTTALLLVLFGLLFLIAAIVVFLLNQQGIIFSA
ncbi:MAG TPA: zinc ribbon domain-containing protein [Ktedonobacteraceae bacterium]|nr:zinc ribbon domain-containing protein [Ktedonobacteraceae bacterium]